MGKSSVRSFQKSLIYYLPEEPGISDHQIALTENTVRLCSLKFIHFNSSVFLATLVAKGVFWQWRLKYRFILVKTGKNGEPLICRLQCVFTWHIHTIPECRSNQCSELRSSRVHAPLLVCTYI